MNLFTKQKTDSDFENKLMVTRAEGWWEGRDWEVGIDMDTLLYLK